MSEKRKPAVEIVLSPYMGSKIATLSVVLNTPQAGMGAVSVRDALQHISGGNSASIAAYDNAVIVSCPISLDDITFRDERDAT